MEDNVYGTAGENRTVLLVGLAVTLVMLAAAWWLRRLAHAMDEGTSLTDWHTGLMLGFVAALVFALCGLILALVAYVILLAHGWVPWWTLLIPAAGIAYGVRWVNTWAMARAKASS
jgi:hypothetical protein